ncbi:hypothetical protein MD484_g178, partial [Candolleomyces efflorescens]
MNFDPEPDLHPLYPTVAQISNLIASQSGLDPAQKEELVKHCLKRASLFGDLALAQYLLSDSTAQTYVDLSVKDEDGVGLVSLTIHGFGGDLDRDIEREECVRFLVTQGADLSSDQAGWSPLHHAALFAPPTLVSYLMTHGCSPFEVTQRNLTPLDIITAHSILPGRDDVALLLEEAMRGEGWTGGRVEQKRRLHDRLTKRKGKQRAIRDDVSKVLGLNPKWCDGDDSGSDSDSDCDDDIGETVFIFDTLITNYPISLKDLTPANTLYLLARFACLTCDHTWLEDLIIGAADTIEDAFFNSADDMTSLIFWLHNTSIWLHLMQSDNSMSEPCEMLGSFELIEEVINSVFGTPIKPAFSESSAKASPYELTSFLTALQTLLVFADINPLFTTQLWSQVFYWTSCEIFNRVITRKKYICRSRAVQINANLSVIDEWAHELHIPAGVLSHFSPVKDLLSWLQCLSSITDFADLVSVIQSFKALNPLQMRRAVRDYRYEVNERRMTEECVQYITQLHKDWERQRVKLGVEALRKEISDRDRERDDSSSMLGGSINGDDRASVLSATSVETTTNRQSIDLLMDKNQEAVIWEPPKPPQVLGELLDSRYMLPLLFPSDPQYLAALPSKCFLETGDASQPQSATISPAPSVRGSMDMGKPGPFQWRSRHRKIREIGVGVLQWVDGAHSASRWSRPIDHSFGAEEEPEEHHDHGHDGADQPEGGDDHEDGGTEAYPEDPDLTLKITTALTPYTRKPSIRRARPSLGDVTPIETSFNGGKP